MNMFLEKQSKKECCGCMACSKICGVSAIEMKQDKCGFYYPKVDKNKCVDCGRCESVCPMKENYVGQDADPDIYAVINRDTHVLKYSSSGGMFTLLAEWILEQNGVIYGVAFDENFYVCHQRAQTMEEAAKFRTSKYVESDIKEVYKYLLSDLSEGKTVLLTGTPCQISAINKYLKAKKISTEKLYTCDNICHGVPSRKIWNDYLNILKSKYIIADDEIVSINMRSKKHNWKNQEMDIELKKGNINDIIQKFSFNQFFRSLFGHRPSCFNCKYTSYKRPADFTLGDFWSVENAMISFDVDNGVNVVLVNTEKGRNLFELIKNKAKIQKVTKKAAWQAHLEYAAKAPAKRKEFWENYLKMENKEEVLCRYMRGSFLNKMIRKMTPVLRKTGLYAFAGKMYKVVLLKK